MELIMKDELINAAIAQFQSQRLAARANLLVYFANPMGVGEHPDLVEEVVGLTKKIAEAEECIDILQGMASK